MSDSDIASDLKKKEMEVSENGDADKTKMETDQDESKTEENKVEEPVKKSSPKKKEKKKKGKEEKKEKEEDKKEEKEEEDKTEKDEEEEDDEEPPLGLLERPIELTSGKREKKKVERLSMSISLPSSEKKKIDIPEGSGKRLGDCPRIEFKLNHIKAIDLKPLHRLLFNRAGSNTEVKKNIRQFNGFSFGKSDKEFEKRTATLNKMTIPQLKQICEVLDIERSGTKPAIIERILDFLLNPTSSGLKVPEKKKKKTKGGGDADKKKGTKRKRTSKKDKKAKKETVSDISDSDEDEDEEEEKSKEKEDKKRDKKEEKIKPKAKAKKESDEEDEEEVEDEEEEEEEEEEPPKKKTKTDKKPVKKESPKAKKQNGKQEKAKPGDKKKKKESKKKTSDSESDMDSDDEPLAAKKDEPPSNSELKELIKKLLDGANLEEVTMKTVVKQVYDRYPSFDLTDRKDFIKSTVREIIS